MTEQFPTAATPAPQAGAQADENRQEDRAILSFSFLLALLLSFFVISLEQVPPTATDLAHLFNSN